MKSCLSIPGFVCLFAAASLSAAHPGAIEVATAPRFFNPSLGEVATLRVAVARPGRLTVTVLDRDRYVVRTLVRQAVEPGALRLSWNGRDARGEVVPDEAYSLRVELEGREGRQLWDPADGFAPEVEEPAAPAFSRADGLLSYVLSRPSRVHVQAGQAVIDPRTGRAGGPVLKTVVDRAPRVAGAVVERWNGRDESGTIVVPDLPHFAVAVVATSLPEGSLITIGNRRRSFLEYAAARGPARQVPGGRGAPGRHHAGLSSLEDRSPPLALSSSAVWDEGRGIWQVEGPLRLEALLAPGDARPFLGRESELVLFLDERPLLRRRRPANPAVIVLGSGLPPGEHRLAVNWASGRGPVAVNALKIEVRGAAGRVAKGAR